MTDSAISIKTARRRFLSGPNDSEAARDSAYAAAALEVHKREGLELAVRARWIALGITAVFLVFVNPAWNVLYYHFILALLCLNGWFMRKVGRVGQSRTELALLLIDLVIMTFGMVVPNPFGPEGHPVAMQYRFDNFSYFFIFLAAGTMAYSWRTVMAIGTWSAGVWTIGLVMAIWFSEPMPDVSEAVASALANYPQIAEDLDPNNFRISLRVQEVLVFMLVAVTLGVSTRRFNMLLLNNAGLERERTNLSRYFSPNVVEELSQNDDPLKRTRTHDVAVMFVDIVGFTSFAAHRSPEQVIDTLRAFHSRMEARVFAHSGTLDKFLGDGLMATFGTPKAGERDATNALECARDIVAEVDQWNAERAKRGEESICVSCGIHFGSVVLGDIGGTQLEFAVIGNTVNVASRIEGLTRPLQARIAISEDCRAQIERESGANHRTLTGLAQTSEQTIRGVDEPMKLWIMR